MKRYFVYILASKSRVLYTGVTSNLERRTHIHKSQSVPGFTAKYKVHRLVYFEETNDVHSAIAREKQIKSWRRSKKVALVETANPTWEDLSETWNKKQIPHAGHPGESPIRGDPVCGARNDRQNPQNSGCPFWNQEIGQ